MHSPAHRAERVTPRLLHRLLNGRPLQPCRAPRRLLTVVSGDLDTAAGVAGLWLVRRPRSAHATSHTLLFERCGRDWTYVGGSSGTADPLPGRRRKAGEPGQAGMVEVAGTGSVVSRAHVAHLHDVAPLALPLIGCAELHVAAEVDHLVAGGRRVEVPAHGSLIVVWRFPPLPGTAAPGKALSGPAATRPLIRCLAADGSPLSELRPGDYLDSFTWQRLRGQSRP
ncbi:hypothetical protein ACH4OW_09455 [Streptomyces sp. NPDC017056]|uniref:hypothetical protein n=1 Tax=Streptomyces sp. NPDC017056 TaxID=3364973 RepID=UPI0037947BC4